MAKAKVRHGSNFLVTAISLFVILLVVNAFSYRHFVRWDLTRNKEYTISETTRDMLANLDNIVNVKVYLSEELPAALLTFDRQLRDILAEYQVYGKGNLKVDYLDPAEDPTKQQELMMKGIQPQVVGVFTGDTQTRTQVYNSILVEFEGKSEIISSLLDRVEQGVGLVGDFEYMLTSKIAKLMRTGNPAIGLLTNNPNVSLQEQYSALQEFLRQEWDVQVVQFDEPRRIPANIAVLVVVSPRNFSQAHLFELDQFVMRGGKIMALVDTFDQPQGRSPDLTAAPSNFTDVLAHYGVVVNDEVVFDTRYHAHAPISGRFLAPYPFWVHIMKTGMNQDDRIVAGLDRLTLPWPQSLDQSSTVAAGVEYEPLAWSSRFSKVRWGDRISIDHRTPAPNESSSMTSHTLIAAVRGALPSYFPEGTPIPDPATTETVSNRTREEDRRYVAQDAGIVVIGNSLFLQDDLLRMWRVPFNTNDDAAFFFNGVESLAFGETLGQIRARRRSAMPIDPDLKEGTKNTYKVAGTFLMPILVVFGGVVYSRVRRRRRRAVANRILKS